MRRAALFISVVLMISPGKRLGSNHEATTGYVRWRHGLVPAGTAVPVHLVGSVTSASAKRGDTFQIQAAQDVVVGNMVVIPQGAGGEGTITSVDAAAGNGHSGALGLSFSFICSADGSKISLLDTTQKQTEGDRKGGASAATIIGVATFGVTGLFAHNLARRRRKVVDGKMIMTIQPWS